MMRLFIAIDLPEKIKDELALISFGLPQARWVKPEQLHLTLRFIGEVDGALFQELKSGLESVSGSSFSLLLQGLGCFPPRRDPRVLWVGIEESVELMRLRKKVDSFLAKLGIPSEYRKFSPHITLARTPKTPLTRVTRFLGDHALFRLPEFTVSSFHLYSSILTPKGALHRHEAEYLLMNV
ncbi:MAG: RNA 2',3'-cyclic phosphodiesterase [Pseudomonadota bacterium]|nr:RNA 2',3'-cyclic phosphodiesterase [Pseudomonadota bacterium]